MKEAYIIAGGNGSGKTTIGKEIQEKNKYDFINADEISKEIHGEYKNKLIVGKEFFNRLNKLIEENKSFIIETTLSGKYVGELIDKFRENNYSITLIFIFLKSFKEAIKRIDNRVKEGGHFVPHEDVKRRYYRSINNFEKNYKDKVDKWQLIYNGFRFYEIAQCENPNPPVIKFQYKLFYRKYEKIKNDEKEYK